MILAPLSGATRRWQVTRRRSPPGMTIIWGFLAAPLARLSAIILQISARGSAGGPVCRTDVRLLGDTVNGYSFLAGLARVVSRWHRFSVICWRPPFLAGLSRCRARNGMPSSRHAIAGVTTTGVATTRAVTRVRRSPARSQPRHARGSLRPAAPERPARYQPAEAGLPGPRLGRPRHAWLSPCRRDSSC